MLAALGKAESQFGCKGKAVLVICSFKPNFSDHITIQVKKVQE